MRSFFCAMTVAAKRLSSRKMTKDTPSYKRFLPRRYRNCGKVFLTSHKCAIELINQTLLIKVYMKNLLSAVGTTLLVLTACTGNSNEPDTSKTEISANLESGRIWKSGDEVLINGATYTISDGAGTSTATIKDVNTAAKYCAAYDFGSGTIDGETLTFTVPQAQSTAASLPAPMVACNANPVLTFKYLLGTLKIKFTGEEKTITKVALTSEDGAKLSGRASVNLNFTGAPELVMSSEAAADVTIDLGDGIRTNGDTPVEVTLPAASYAGFYVTAYDSEGGVMVAEPLASVQIARGESSEASIEYKAAETEEYLTVNAENDAAGNAVTWNANSAVYVNGIPATLYSGAGSSTAQFGPITSADRYCVSTSSASVNGVSGSTMRVEIPAKQSYGASLFSINPMAGSSTGKNADLKFVGGVISVKVTGAHVIKSLELKTKGSARIAGEGVINLDVADFAFSVNASGSSAVTVQSEAGVDAENGAEFRFVVPAGTYSDGFTLTATDSKNAISQFDIEGVTVKCNTISALADQTWSGASSGANDLSATGYSNCYIVSGAGDYTFGTMTVDNAQISGIDKVDWLWATKIEGNDGNALVSDISYADGKVSFKASDLKGNVLLAAFNSKSEIVWSWHIWLTDAPETFDMENNPIYMSGGKTNGFFMMDRNLGATGTTGDAAFGLFYQWGRKDPFIGGLEAESVRQDSGDWTEATVFGKSGDYTVCNTKYTQAKWENQPCTTEIGSVEYATAHPMLFIYAGPDSNQANWVMKSNVSSDIWWDEDRTLWRPGEKSNYDPCPVGYRMPKNGTFNTFNNAYAVWQDNVGVTLYTAGGEISSWFPYQGYRSAHSSDKGALIYTKSANGSVCLWTGHYSVQERAYSLGVQKPAILYSQDDPWGNGLNVRCVKQF